MITFKDFLEEGICWTGYKRKKGTKPYEDGSCMKEELENHHAMAFGRMNPITSGHEAVVNKLHSVAKEHGASHSLIVSHSQDAKKNPLTGEQKVAHAKNAFPKTNVSSASKEAPTILHHAAAAHKAGATHLHVVAGSDRHEEMHNLLHKYNGKDSAHGHYNFKKITVHSSGERDPDSEGTTGISASKMREHAASGNKEAFHAGAPSNMKPKHKDAMYNDVRKGMNIKEETMDQQADRAAQLKRFKDQMTKGNGPQKDTELGLDKKEKEAMEKVNEVLHPDMGAGAYINDFIKSTNPRFNNKSKAERRKMAIGAYMAAKATMKEGTVQGNVAGGDAMNTTTSAPSDNKMPSGSVKKVKGFKFFNGTNEPNTQMTVKEEKKDDVPFDGPYTSSFKKPNNPNRTGMDSARSLAQRAMDQVSKKKPVKEEVDQIEEGYDKSSEHHKNARKMAKDYGGKATFHPNGHAEVRMRSIVHGHSTLNPQGTTLMSGEDLANRASKEHGKGKVQGNVVHFKEGYYEKPASAYRRKGDEVRDPTPVAPVPDRKYIKGTPENKALRAKNKPINGHPTNEEILDERNKENALMRKTMDASRGAKFKLKNPVPDADPKHKTARDHNVAIGRALRNEAATGNPGGGYHGACGTADEKYEEMHKHVKNLTDGDDKTVKHYLDSGHGEKLAGREEDHDHIKTDFKKFMKYYRPEMREPKPAVKEETAPIGKPQKITLKTAVIKLHPKGVASDTEEGWAKPKKIKEETMKSYKEFLQSLDEKLIGGQNKLDKNHNNKLDAQDFKLLRKEETETLDEIKMSELPSRKIQGKSYGADYTDPEGADETAADMKKPEKKTAGRKAGSGAGVYKPRQTMSKLKQAGATYK